jgi:hypothetical protein
MRGALRPRPLEAEILKRSRVLLQTSGGWNAEEAAAAYEPARLRIRGPGAAFANTNPPPPSAAANDPLPPPAAAATPLLPHSLRPRHCCHVIPLPVVPLPPHPPRRHSTIVARWSESELDASRSAHETELQRPASELDTLARHGPGEIGEATPTKRCRGTDGDLG